MVLIVLPYIIYFCVSFLDNTAFSPLKDSPVRKFIKELTNELSSSKEIIELEEESRGSKRSISNKSLSKSKVPNNERKGSFFDFHSSKGTYSGKKQSPEAKDIKTRDLSKKGKFQDENQRKNNVVIPQNPFSQVTIDYNAENERIVHKKIDEDRFGEMMNYNYSLKPRNEKKIQYTSKNYVKNIKNEKNDLTSDESTVFKSVGFALVNTLSLHRKHQKNFEEFEIKKGEPVCIRVLKEDRNFLECKYNEKIGFFHSKDFYFWDNNIPAEFQEEDILSPTSKDKPIQPNFFIRSHR